MQTFLIPLIVFVILETDKEWGLSPRFVFSSLKSVEVVILKLRDRNLLFVWWGTSEQTEEEI